MKSLRKPGISPKAAEDLLRGRRICLVDDDSGQAILLKGCLKGLDTSISAFLSAEEAQAFLSHNPVDYIFCDVMMPEMDGWELHSAVRAEGTNQDTPFLFMTCLISPQQERGMADPASRCLTLAKPLRRRALLDAVARLAAATAECSPED